MDSNGDIYDNKKILLAIAAGDLRAFATFFNTYSPRIWQVAMKLTRSAEVAEELTQDFFIKLWDKREALTEVKSPGGYFYTLIYNLSIDYSRRKGTETRAMDAQRREVLEHGNNIQERIDERQLQKNIEKATQQLPELHQKVFRLRHQEQVSYDDIAVALGITRSTAQSYFYQSIKAIREFLDRTGSTGSAS